MDTGDRSVTFEMDALNSTETDFRSQMHASFALLRLDSNIFLIWKSATSAFLAVKQIVRFMRHYDQMLAGVFGPGRLWAEGHEDLSC